MIQTYQIKSYTITIDEEEKRCWFKHKRNEPGSSGSLWLDTDGTKEVVDHDGAWHVPDDVLVFIENYGCSIQPILDRYNETEEQ